MADGLLLISEPLCFIRNKFGNIPEKDLKNIVRDFYTVDVLVLAKLDLLMILYNTNRRVRHHR